jgi:hypothetical protein
MPSPNRSRKHLPSVTALAVAIAIGAWGCRSTVTNDTTSASGSTGVGGGPRTTSATGGGGASATVSTGHGGGSAGGSSTASGGGGAGGAPNAGTCEGTAAPPANAVSASDPPPTEMQTSTSIVLRKELAGYPNYGVADSACDITYDGDADAWMFQVPNVPISSATLALSVVADDHASVPLDGYFCQVWAGNSCVFGDQAPVMHGAPFNADFSDWSELDVPVTVTPGNFLIVTFANRSTTGVASDWIGIDWIELRLTTP